MPAKSTIVSIFPPGFFLENIAAVPGGGLLISVANRAELYYIPPRLPDASGPSTPLLLKAFPHDQAAMGIVCAPNNPNVFYLLTTDLLSTGAKKSYLNVLDLSNPAIGATPIPIMTFPPETRALNGLCALSEKVLLAADSFGSQIWRIDLDLDSGSASAAPKSASARTWLEDHDTMQGELKLPDFQPGTNGLKYSPKTGYVCYTSTQQKLFCRVAVDAKTLDPRREVEVVARGMQGDDMLIDDEWQGEGGKRSVAYVTTHRDNTILRIAIDEQAEIKMENVEVVVQGTDEDDTVVGPTAGTWHIGQEGKVAYFTSDGGLKHTLSNGIVRCAKVVMVDF